MEVTPVSGAVARRAGTASIRTRATPSPDGGFCVGRRPRYDGGEGLNGDVEQDFLAVLQDGTIKSDRQRGFRVTLRASRGLCDAR